MQCPVDNSTLLLSERQGVEIDYCPQCRGVWLDRGELDKLIQRESSDYDDDDDDRRERYRDRDRDFERDRGYDRDRDYRPGYSKKKRSLADLFDFG